MFFQTYVNVEKRTLVVKGTNPVEELYREYLDFFHKHKLHPYGLFDAFEKKYGSQIEKITGVAQCNEDFGDVFDEDFGFELAKERYMRTFEAYRTKMYEMIYASTSKMANDAYKRVESAVIRRYGREDNIDYLINSLKEKADNE